jgi:hypothetical protein
MRTVRHEVYYSRNPNWLLLNNLIYIIIYNDGISDSFCFLRSVFFCNGMYFVDGILVICVMAASERVRACVSGLYTHGREPNRNGHFLHPQPNLRTQTIK